MGLTKCISNCNGGRYKNNNNNHTHLIILLLSFIALSLSPVTAYPQIVHHNNNNNNNVEQLPVVVTMRQVVEQCRNATGATESDFEAMVRKEPATTMQAKCLRACLMKSFGLMDGDGKFDRDVALQIVSDHIAEKDIKKMQIVEEILEICHKLPVSTNHCEAAEQYGKCASDYVASRSLRMESS